MHIHSVCDCVNISVCVCVNISVCVCLLSKVRGRGGAYCWEFDSAKYTGRLSTLAVPWSPFSILPLTHHPHPPTFPGRSRCNKLEIKATACWDPSTAGLMHEVRLLQLRSKATSETNM